MSVLFNDYDIAIKKLLFMLSIIWLDEDIVIRNVFVSSFDAFMLNIEHNSINTYRSPVYEMCKYVKNSGF